MTTKWWPKAGQSGGLTERAYAVWREVIKTADWLIDLGPEGGVRGGKIVAVGTPETVVKEPQSYTGHYLKPLLA